MGINLNNLSLVELYNYPSVNRVSEFAQVARDLDIDNLVEKYQDLVKTAPRRHETGKKYFVGHTRFQANEDSNRKEEILAGELFNYCQDGNAFTLPDDRQLKIIDYQFPLKARQGNQGIGKIDLFGVMDDSTPCVIELKVDQEGGKKPDTPLRALIEGLAYCAIVESNMKEIQSEAHNIFGYDLKVRQPELIVLAPCEYWEYYENKNLGEAWKSNLRALILKTKNHFPLIKFFKLTNHDLTSAF